MSDADGRQLGLFELDPPRGAPQRPWPNKPTRYPFVALINGVEKTYSKPPREKSLAEKLRATSGKLLEMESRKG